MSDPNSDPRTIAVLADILVSDGYVPLNFGGNTFEVRYQAGYVTPDIYDQTEEAINVITAVTSFALSPTGSSLIQGQGEIVWINVTNDPDGQDSGAMRLAGVQPIVNINTTQVGDLYRAADGTYQVFNLQHIVNHELVHIFGDPEDTPNHNGITNAANGETLGGPPRSNDYFDTITQNEFCFLGDTAISMWPLDLTIKPRADGAYDQELVLSKVWKKPISEIKVGDIVVSYDNNGRIAPGPVTRTMQSKATHILDFWDTGVTPGHAYLCGDGVFKGQHVPLMDILRTDGAIVRDDGTLLRAATNCEVGSLGDRMIHATASVKKPDGTWTEQKRGQVRFGTRIILPDGRHMSFMEMAQSKGWGLSEDGAMIAKVKTENVIEEQEFFFPYNYGEELPKPEDYILSRSEVSLQEIYAAGEWEQIGTRMPAPADMVGLNTNHTSPLPQPSKPEPNTPPAFANRPDVPSRAQPQTAQGDGSQTTQNGKFRKSALVS